MPGVSVHEPFGFGWFTSICTFTNPLTGWGGWGGGRTEGGKEEEDDDRRAGNELAQPRRQGPWSR